MKPVVIIRPQPGCSATVSAAQELNLNAHGFPMFRVRPMPWTMPDPDEFDALLIGSGNAIRHGGAAIANLAGKPAYAVGESTARMASEAGLAVVIAGEGGLQDLLGVLEPEHKRLLRLAGEQRIDLTAPEGVTIDERTVYSVDRQTMPVQLAKMLDRPALVLLHSARAAQHFASSCAARNIDRSLISLACIGERVADAAGDGWREVESAQAPNDGGLLALAARMCEGDGAGTRNETRKGPMQDQSASFPMTAQPTARRSVKGQILVALLAFTLGAALVGWAVWRGYFGGGDQTGAAALAASGGSVPDAESPGEAPVEQTEAAQMQAVSTVEGRLAMLEDRFSRLNLQANAASGNAARAESLLIAFAARRMIDRGEPLRYLEDQLRLRFSNAQPRAVDAIIEFSAQPVTIDELSARLDALAPRLSGEAEDESFWDTATRELASLFTVRREPASLMSPEARIERARVMLTAGKIPEAVEQVKLLPGAEAAERWITDALRYETVQKSLDIIETTAMLDPSRLQDAEGNKVDQPSPLATPAAKEATPAKKQ